MVKIEVTKYYCDNCEIEVPTGEFTKLEVRVSFRSLKYGCGESAHAYKSICNKCVEDLGFPLHPEDNQIYDVQNKLSKIGRFMEVIKMALRKDK